MVEAEAEQPRRCLGPEAARHLEPRGSRARGELLRGLRQPERLHEARVEPRERHRPARIGDLHGRRRGRARRRGRSGGGRGERLLHAEDEVLEGLGDPLTFVEHRICHRILLPRVGRDDHALRDRGVLAGRRVDDVPDRD